MESKPLIKDWERPWTTDEMKEHSATWNLAGDAGLLNHLKQFSQNLLARTHQTQTALDSLMADLSDTGSDIGNITNTFLALANTQFVENRVYDDEDKETPSEGSKEEAKEKSKEEQEAEMVANVRRALELGMSVLDDMFDTVEVPGSDSEEEDSVPRIVYEPRDPYANRPLPCLIGSTEFFEDDNVGLGEDTDNSTECTAPLESDSDSEPERLNIDLDAGRDILFESSSGSEVSEHDPHQSKVDTMPEPGGDMFGRDSPQDEPANIPSATKEVTADSSFAAELAARLGGVAAAVKKPQPPSENLFEPVSDQEDDSFLESGSGKFSGGWGLFDEPGHSPEKKPTIPEKSPAKSAESKKTPWLFGSESGGLFGEESTQAVEDDDDDIFRAPNKSVSSRQPKLPAGAVSVLPGKITPLPRRGPSAGAEKLDWAAMSADGTDASSRPSNTTSTPYNSSRSSDTLSGSLFDNEDDSLLFQTSVNSSRAKIGADGRSSELFDENYGSGGLFGAPRPKPDHEPVKTSQASKKQILLFDDPDLGEDELFFSVNSQPSQSKVKTFSDDPFRQLESRGGTKRSKDNLPVDDIFSAAVLAKPRIGAPSTKDIFSSSPGESRTDPKSTKDIFSSSLGDPGMGSKSTKDIFSASMGDPGLGPKSTKDIFSASLGDPGMGSKSTKDIFSASMGDSGMGPKSTKDIFSASMGDSGMGPKSTKDIFSSSMGDSGMGPKSTKDIFSSSLGDPGMGPKSTKDIFSAAPLDKSGAGTSSAKDIFSGLSVTGNSFDDGVDDIFAIPAAKLPQRAATQVASAKISDLFSKIGAENEEDDIFATLQPKKRTLVMDPDLFGSGDNSSSKKPTSTNIPDLFGHVDNLGSGHSMKPTSTDAPDLFSSVKNSPIQSKNSTSMNVPDLFGHVSSSPVHSKEPLSTDDPDLFSSVSNRSLTSSISSSSTFVSAAQSDEEKSTKMIQKISQKPNITASKPSLDSIAKPRLAPPGSSAGTRSVDAISSPNQPVKETSPNKPEAEESAKPATVSKPEPPKTLNIRKTTDPAIMTPSIEDEDLFYDFGKPPEDGKRAHVLKWSPESDEPSTQAKTEPSIVKGRGPVPLPRLNINPAALLPGAKPPTRVSQSGSSGANSPSGGVVEPEAAVGFDQPADKQSTSLHIVGKDRAKIPVRRRPQSRRARQEALRASAIDLEVDLAAGKDWESTDLPPSAPGSPDPRSPGRSSPPELPGAILSPSTDEEDFFGVPQDLPCEYGAPREQMAAGGRNLFGGAPVLSPLEYPRTTILPDTKIISSVEELFPHDNDNHKLFGRAGKVPSPPSDLFGKLEDAGKMKEHDLFTTDVNATKDSFVYQEGPPSAEYLDAEDGSEEFAGPRFTNDVAKPSLPKEQDLFFDKHTPDTSDNIFGSASDDIFSIGVSKSITTAGGDSLFAPFKKPPPLQTLSVGDEDLFGSVEKMKETDDKDTLFADSKKKELPSETEWRSAGAELFSGESPDDLFSSAIAPLKKPVASLATTSFPKASLPASNSSLFDDDDSDIFSGSLFSKSSTKQTKAMDSSKPPSQTVPRPGNAKPDKEDVFEDPLMAVQK